MSTEATPAPAPAAPSSPPELYAALESYPWDDDVEFQSGLSAILGTNSSPEQARELTLRARCFYYSRKFNVSIDFDAYRAYHTSRNPSTSTSTTTPPAPAPAPTATTTTTPPDPASGILPTAPADPSDPPAPYPTSFAHIVDLITSGKPIPGIKEIPNTVLEGQGTAPVRAKRRKPWEKDDADGAASSSS